MLSKEFHFLKASKNSFNVTSSSFVFGIFCTFQSKNSTFSNKNDEIFFLLRTNQNFTRTNWPKKYFTALNKNCTNWKCIHQGIPVFIFCIRLLISDILDGKEIKVNLNFIMSSQYWWRTYYYIWLHIWSLKFRWFYVIAFQSHSNLEPFNSEPECILDVNQSNILLLVASRKWQLDKI